MRKRDKEAIRKKLLEARDRIQRNASQTMNHITNPNLDDLNDEVDVATEEHHQTFHYACVTAKPCCWKKLRKHWDALTMKSLVSAIAVVVRSA